nr:PepSY domain-containing protein [uncultured Desulfobulbus sp.]
MKKNIFLAVLTLSFTALSSASFASMMQNDALATPAPQIDLSRAVAIAEQATSGTATKAELEQYDDQWVYDVEVVQGKKVMDVTIDPKSGMVLSSKLDQADHEKEQECDEEHEQKD